MCGRFSLTYPDDELRALLDDVDGSVEHEPRFNIAPGQDAPLLLCGASRPRLTSMPWGFSPASGVRDDARGGWINARAESVDRRPAFREAFRLRRALVPADGFYEWAAGESGRQPYHVTAVAGGLLGLAAIWEEVPGQGFAILTRPATPGLAALHPRMPVVLGRQAWRAWLDPATPRQTLLDLLREPPPELGSRPVSRVVNSARYDGPECLDPASAEREAAGSDSTAPGEDAVQTSLFDGPGSGS